MKIIIIFLMALIFDMQKAEANQYKILDDYDKCVNSSAPIYMNLPKNLKGTPYDKIDPSFSYSHCLSSILNFPKDQWINLSMARVLMAMDKMPDSIPYYKKSASLGNSEAQATLGMLYLDGLNLDKDLIKAETWLIASARAGNPKGTIFLAKLNVLEGNYSKSIKILEPLYEKNLCKFDDGLKYKGLCENYLGVAYRNIDKSDSKWAYYYANTILSGTNFKFPENVILEKLIKSNKYPDLAVRFASVKFGPLRALETEYLVCRRAIYKDDFDYDLASVHIKSCIKEIDEKFNVTSKISGKELYQYEGLYELLSRDCSGHNCSKQLFQSLISSRLTILNKSAESNYAGAKIKLATYKLNGEKVRYHYGEDLMVVDMMKKNFEEGFSTLESLIKNGKEPYAATALATYYEEKNDLNLAIKYYKIAKLLGHPNAESLLKRVTGANKSYCEKNPEVCAFGAIGALLLGGAISGGSSDNENDNTRPCDWGDVMMGNGYTGQRCRKR